MSTTRRNFLWPLLIIAVGVLMWFLATDMLPQNVGDLMERSWPVLLVIFGLNALLYDRVRFGNWLALVISLVFLGGVVWYAYQIRADDMRADYIEILNPIPLGDHIQGVTVEVEALDATVIFRPYNPEESDTQHAIGAKFTGSRESRIEVSVQENEDGIVNLTITEKRPNSLPNLRYVGRGQLEIYLPREVPIQALNFRNRKGLVTLDLRLLDVPRFDISNASGDIDLYMPLNSIVIGDISIEKGNLQIIIPPQISLRISGAPANREINVNDYLSVQGGDIESRGGLTAFQVNLQVNIPNGTLTIKPQ